MSHIIIIFIIGMICLLQFFVLIMAQIIGEQSGIIFRIKSFWIGIHYSEYHKRYCVNIIPGITVWWTQKNGDPPIKL